MSETKFAGPPTHKEAAPSPFIRFPNSVARDSRLGAKAIVVLAYRSTFVDGKSGYGLNEVHLRNNPIVKSRSGLGKNGIRDAIRDCKEAGYLTRSQSGRTQGKWRTAVDVVALPPCGATGHAGQHLRREWFDGSLSLKAMAAWIFLRAGTGKGPRTYASEVRNRFGWSRPTAANVLDELEAAGLIAIHVSRSANGQMKATTYAPQPAHLWGIWATVKKRGDGLRGDGFLGHSRNCPSHALSEPYLRRLRRSYSAPSAKPTFDLEEIRSQAWWSPNLLAGLDAGQGQLSPELWDIAEETEVAIRNAVADDDLTGRIRRATGGRVSAEILAPAGLYAVRWLASLAATAAGDVGADVEPHGVLDYVIDALKARIGSREGEWLNSLALIGQRLIGDAYNGRIPEALYGPRAQETWDGSLTSENGVVFDWLADLGRADGAKVLAPQVMRDHSGLQRLVREHPDALDVILRLLTRAMIDLPEVGSIKSWNYFRGAIDDESRSNEMERLDLRPGDCLGAHKKRASND